jgi:Flp pilus assembly pilin Flp
MTVVRRFLCRFLPEEWGQDLVEHGLLLAFVALASAALFLGAGGSVNAIWTSGSATLDTASSATSGSSGSTGSTGTTGSTGSTGPSGFITGCDHCRDGGQ